MLPVLPQAHVLDDGRPPDAEVLPLRVPAPSRLQVPLLARPQPVPRAAAPGPRVPSLGPQLRAPLRGDPAQGGREL